MLILSWQVHILDKFLKIWYPLVFGTCYPIYCFGILFFILLRLCMRGRGKTVKLPPLFLDYGVYGKNLTGVFAKSRIS